MPCLFWSCKQRSDLGPTSNINIFTFGRLISKIFAAHEPLGYGSCRESKITLGLGTLFFGLDLIKRAYGSQCLGPLPTRDERSSVSTVEERTMQSADTAKQG